MPGWPQRRSAGADSPRSATNRAGVCTSEDCPKNQMGMEAAAEIDMRFLSGPHQQALEDVAFEAVQIQFHHVKILRGAPDVHLSQHICR